MPFLFLKNTSRPRTDMITHLGPMLHFPYMKLIKKALRVWREKPVMCITWELAELSRLSGDFINNLNCFLWYPSWPSQIKNKNSSLWEKKKKPRGQSPRNYCEVKVSGSEFSWKNQFESNQKKKKGCILENWPLISRVWVFKVFSKFDTIFTIVDGVFFQYR